MKAFGTLVMVLLAGCSTTQIDYPHEESIHLVQPELLSFSGSENGQFISWQTNLGPEQILADSTGSGFILEISGMFADPAGHAWLSIFSDKDPIVPLASKFLSQTDLRALDLRPQYWPIQWDGASNDGEKITLVVAVKSPGRSDIIVDFVTENPQVEFPADDFQSHFDAKKFRTTDQRIPKNLTLFHYEKFRTLTISQLTGTFHESEHTIEHSISRTESEAGISYQWQLDLSHQIGRSHISTQWDWETSLLNLDAAANLNGHPVSAHYSGIRFDSMQLPFLDSWGTGNSSVSSEGLVEIDGAKSVDFFDYEFMAISPDPMAPTK